MKRILRHYTIDTFALWVSSQIAQGLVFENGFQTLLVAGVVLVGATLLAKPVINILLLPLNLMTFGFFRWVSSAIALYIVTLVIPAFKVLRFQFLGFHSEWFDIPQINLSGVLSFVAFSFLISIITSFIHWLRK